MRTRPLREIFTAVAALVICLVCMTVGTWIFLRLSGARDEFRLLRDAARDTASPGQSPPSRALDPDVLMAAWSLPVMLGILGGAAVCTGLWTGAMSRSKVALIATVGIIPLYVISFTTGLSWSNVTWAGL
jgi:hypothetical protein